MTRVIRNSFQVTPNRNVYRLSRHKIVIQITAPQFRRRKRAPWRASLINSADRKTGSGGVQFVSPPKDAYDPAYSVILDGLIARRQAFGMTQVELAEAMGSDQSQISKFERRERRIDVIDYVRFCTALKIDPAELLTDAAVLLIK